MKRLIVICLTSLLFISGCDNLSPRQEQKIDAQNSKIGEIENMANSIKTEVGNLKTQTDIQDSKIGQMQEGLANWQSNYENSGIQIFSGPGGLITAIVGLFAMSLITMHYRRSAKKNEKTADILAEAVANKKDPELEDEVFKAAMHTEIEENMLKVMKKHQSKRG